MLKLVFLQTCRPNIFYEVKRRISLESDLDHVLCSLRSMLLVFSSTASHSVCVLICLLTVSTLNWVRIPSIHLVLHMWVSTGCMACNHSGTTRHNKDVVLKSLLQPNGIVKVVFTTVALNGMGVNLQDVDTIINYGAPRSLGDYFQESGRGGRSGSDVISTIYWIPRDSCIKKSPILLSMIMKPLLLGNTCKHTTICRRKWLLDHFDVRMDKGFELCCDVCSNTAAIHNSGAEEGDDIFDNEDEDESDFD